MIIDNTEFVLSPDQSVKNESFSANPIKTRRKSFNAIREKYERQLETLFNALDSSNKDFVEQKLENAKNILVEEKYDAENKFELTDAAKFQMNMMTKIVARLEEKIKILSLEDVPENYVSHRAIKLKQKMMNNLVYNSDSKL